MCLTFHGSTCPIKIPQDKMAANFVIAKTNTQTVMGRLELLKPTLEISLCFILSSDRPIVLVFIPIMTISQCSKLNV